jgi:hypothetical protein
VAEVYAIFIQYNSHICFGQLGALEPLGKVDSMVWTVTGKLLRSVNYALILLFVLCNAAFSWDPPAPILSPADPDLAILPIVPLVVLTCPQGIFYVGAGDGCEGAPPGTPQYPNLLDGYVARPPWNVAGVDYHVGIPAGTVLTDWMNISDPNISISTGTVRCQGAGASVTLDAIDFSLHGGAYIYIPSGGCSKLTITASKFGCNEYNFSGPAYTFIADQNNAFVILMASNINPGNCGGLSSPVIGANVLQYNWFQTGFNTNGSGQFASGPAARDLDPRWNYIDDMNICTTCGLHQNYVQWTTISDMNVTWKFNTSTQYHPGGAEGPQFYANNSGKFGTIDFSFNTQISKPNGNNKTMSYMVHGNCHSVGDCSSTTTKISGWAINANNYFDTSGSYGAYYPGSFTSWTNSGNIDMNTGSVIQQ